MDAKVYKEFEAHWEFQGRLYVVRGTASHAQVSTLGGRATIALKNNLAALRTEDEPLLKRFFKVAMIANMERLCAAIQAYVDANKKRIPSQVGLLNGFFHEKALERLKKQEWRGQT